MGQAIGGLIGSREAASGSSQWRSRPGPQTRRAALCRGRRRPARRSSFRPSSTARRIASFRSPHSSPSTGRSSPGSPSSTRPTRQQLDLDQMLGALVAVAPIVGTLRVVSAAGRSSARPGSPTPSTRPEAPEPPSGARVVIRLALSSHQMLVGLLISWAVIAVMFAVTTWILPGMEVSGGFWGYLWVSLLFGIVNAFIGTILRILTFPLTVLTFGLFSILVNAFLLQITDAHLGSLHDRRVLVDGDLGRDHHGDRLVRARHVSWAARAAAHGDAVLALREQRCRPLSAAGASGRSASLMKGRISSRITRRPSRIRVRSCRREDIDHGAHQEDEVDRHRREDQDPHDHMFSRSGLRG